MTVLGFAYVPFAVPRVPLGRHAPSACSRRVAVQRGLLGRRARGLRRTGWPIYLALLLARSR